MKNKNTLHLINLCENMNDLTEYTTKQVSIRQNNLWLGETLRPLKLTPSKFKGHLYPRQRFLVWPGNSSSSPVIVHLQRLQGVLLDVSAQSVTSAAEFKVYNPARQTPK